MASPQIGSDCVSGDDDKVRQEVASAMAEVSGISDRIREALECPVCLDLNTEVMSYCPSGHVICTTCLQKLKTNGCPMCRSPMSEYTGGPLTAYRLILALPLVSVLCRYWRYGCGALVRVTDTARHEASCDYCPDVRCMVTTCPWLGTYDLLYDHVRGRHPEAVVSTKGDRLTVTDVNTIKYNRRRVYLVTADRGSTLMWVLMFRKTRTHIQTGVFVLDPKPQTRRPEQPQPQSPPQQQQQQQQQQQRRQQQQQQQQRRQQQQQRRWQQLLWAAGGDARPTGMGYRLTYADPESWCKKRSETRWVGRWPPSSAAAAAAGADDCNRSGDADSYITFRSRTGRVELHWFKHATGRCARASGSSVRVMDVARP